MILLIPADFLITAPSTASTRRYLTWFLGNHYDFLFLMTVMTQVTLSPERSDGWTWRSLDRAWLLKRERRGLVSGKVRSGACQQGSVRGRTRTGDSSWWEGWREKREGPSCCLYRNSVESTLLTPGEWERCLQMGVGEKQKHVTGTGDIGTGHVFIKLD